MVHEVERPLDVAESVSNLNIYGYEDADDVPYYDKAIQEIKNGFLYQCLICTVEIDAKCAMYACPKCYRIFDYECIQEWALTSTAKRADGLWKCPNCYHPSRKVPRKNRHTCWCGKQVNQEPNLLNPNSCGQTCNANICKHGCSKICHIGPHPPCMVYVTVKCKCGKNSAKVHCSEVKAGYKNYRCEEECGRTLPCGIHKCKSICHRGRCGPCTATIKGPIKCYCGSEEAKKMLCKNVDIISRTKSRKGKSWVASFACKNLTEVQYDCKEHTYQNKCAPPSSQKLPCPYSPKLCRSCPCGKTSLKGFEPRKKCTDPIPTCTNICGKDLSCGKHKCPLKCHTSKCMDPCLFIEKSKCLCEQKSFCIPCQFKGPPRCNMKCESLMSCRRHRCLERCCSGRPNAVKRSKRRFHRSRTDDSEIEAEHICLKGCYLKLSCGLHNCNYQCHSGKCPPCLESSSDDLVCPCGKTIVPAPVRCGTKLPPCNNQCITTLRGNRPCGHPSQPHKCHPISEECPPCTYLVEKPCKCGKYQGIKTVCFQEDVSCLQKCGKALANCHHLCEKACHLPGCCQIKCNQICKRQLQWCEHKCAAACHRNQPCPDITCKEAVTVLCGCGRIEKSIQCGANSATESAKITTVLPCDDDCAKLKRHLMLMEAFGIADNPYTSEKALESMALKATSFEQLQLPYDETALCVYASQPVWCSQIESFLMKLINDKDRISLHFKPMKAQQRRFVHSLASAFAVYSESQDQEPKRSVFVKKTQSSCVPFITLAKALPLYQSFKTHVKELRQAEWDKNETKTLLSIPIEDQSEEDRRQVRFNAIILTRVHQGIVATVRECFDEYLRHTLIRNPQYTLNEDKMLIYPDNYLEISTNVETDIKRLEPYFNNICKDKLPGCTIQICKLDAELKETKDEY
ncbi:HDL221Cp [Eremothecium sinecaudum]|uniref:HDL221Cp n=1 Tax=Eremothecium sinecaudum TaxID=45286 RepID=A0A109UZL8_9SACH|nr:HDL221Cp [Eremothecium sinecaudum]AMD20523.1 HDL221Cp [Eremothecium sinecaudum]